MLMITQLVIRHGRPKWPCLLQYQILMRLILRENFWISTHLMEPLLAVIFLNVDIKFYKK